MDVYNYIRHVDRMMECLRDHLLGLDTRFETLLPQTLNGQTAEQQAAYLADRLLFCLAVDEELGREELGHSREWLYEVILLLLTEVDVCDRDLKSVLRLFGLSFTARGILVADVEGSSRFRHLQMDRNPPVERDALEAAMLRLTPSIQRESIYDKLYLYFLNRN